MGEQELVSLVDELEEICLDRPSSEVGFERRVQIERRLIELLAEEETSGEQRRTIRVPCKLEVTVRRAMDEGPGVVTDIGRGGVYVSTRLPAEVGEAIEIEALQDAGEDTLCVHGHVVWTGEKYGNVGYGVRLERPDDQNERNLWRFLLGLLRNLDVAD